MGVPEVIAIIVAAVGGLAGIITAISVLLKSRAEAHKTKADAKKIEIETSDGLLRQSKEVYEMRIRALEEKVVELQKRSELDGKTIIELNRDLGAMRQAAEAQSRQLQIWYSRVEELLEVLQQHGITRPIWAQSS